jgi:hypothetical protein
VCSAVCCALLFAVLCAVLLYSAVRCVLCAVRCVLRAKPQNLFQNISVFSFFPDRITVFQGNLLIQYFLTVLLWKYFQPCCHEELIELDEMLVVGAPKAI